MEPARVIEAASILRDLKALGHCRRPASGQPTTVEKFTADGVALGGGSAGLGPSVSCAATGNAASAARITRAFMHRIARPCSGTRPPPRWSGFRLGNTSAGIQPYQVHQGCRPPSPPLAETVAALRAFLAPRRSSAQLPVTRELISARIVRAAASEACGCSRHPQDWNPS